MHFSHSLSPAWLAPRDGHSHVQRVLHMSNIPPGASHLDLASAVAHFGRATHALLLPARSQALLEMDTIDAAQRVVAAAGSIMVMGRPVRVAYSHSQEINRKAAIRLDGGGGAAPAAHTPGTPGRVLLITVLNAIHPITVDVLDAILRPHGNLLRAVIFEKEGVVNALVEFSSPHEAAAAMTALQGREIYDNCCQLRITVSRNETVNVRDTSEKSKDWTNPSLPARGAGGFGGAPSGGGYGGAAGGYSAPAAAPAQTGYYGGYGGGAAGYGGAPGGYGGSSAAAGAYSDGGRPSYTGYGASTAPHGGGYGGAPPYGGPSGSGFGGRGGPPPHGGGYSGYGGGGPSYGGDRYGGGPPSGGGYGAPYGRGGPGGRGPPGGPGAGHGSVLMVYGLPPAGRMPRGLTFTPDNLFNLMSVFGDVHRIRMMNKPENSAMVQYRSPVEASIALHALRNAPLFDQTVSVNISKHAAIMPGPEIAEYEGSPNNRFRGAPPQKQPHAPCSTLYFSNVPVSADENRLRALFMGLAAPEPGYIRFLPPSGGDAGPRTRRAGFVDFGTVANAMEALVIANNAAIDDSFLRLTFAGKAMRAPHRAEDGAASTGAPGDQHDGEGHGMGDAGAQADHEYAGTEGGEGGSSEAAMAPEQDQTATAAEAETAAPAAETEAPVEAGAQ